MQAMIVYSIRHIKKVTHSGRRYYDQDLVHSLLRNCYKLFHKDHYWSSIFGQFTIMTHILYTSTHNQNFLYQKEKAIHITKYYPIIANACGGKAGKLLL